MFIADKDTVHKLQRIFEPGYTLEEVAYIYDLLRHTNSKNNHYSTGFLEKMVKSKPGDLNKMQEELYYMILWVYLVWDVTVDDYFVDCEIIKKAIGIGVDMTEDEKHKAIYERLTSTWNKYHNLREMNKKPIFNYVRNVATKKIIALNSDYLVVEGWVR